MYFNQQSEAQLSRICKHYVAQSKRDIGNTSLLEMTIGTTLGSIISLRGVRSVDDIDIVMKTVHQIVDEINEVFIIRRDEVKQIARNVIETRVRQFFEQMYVTVVAEGSNNYNSNAIYHYDETVAIDETRRLVTDLQELFKGIGLRFIDHTTEIKLKEEDIKSQPGRSSGPHVSQRRG